MKPNSAARRHVRAALSLAIVGSAVGCRTVSADERHSPSTGGASSASTVLDELADASASDATAREPVPDAGDSLDAGDAGAEDAGVPESCPAGMSHIGRFCIDRFEARLVVLESDGTETAHPPNERPPEGARYAARSSSGFFPQAYISRVESQLACENAGKRLCSRAEWARACEGRRGSTYPYGPVYKPGVCNTAKGHLLTIRFGKSARDWTYERFNDPTLDTEPGFLTKSGELPGCASDEGVFDLVGNLHEWVSDRVTEEFAEKVEAEDVERKHQGWREGNGVFLGGFFSNTAELGPGCKYMTYAHEPTYHDYSTGFRCCARAAPAPGKSPKKPSRQKKR